MHNIISKYAHPDKGLSVPDWSRYTTSIELRTSIYMTRFLQGPFFYSPFCNLIKQILGDMPWEDLDKCNNDYNKYKIFVEAEGCFRAMVDPIYMSRDIPRIFTYGKTPDFILRTSLKSPMNRLPLNRPWNIVAANVQPIRILYHNALELITDLSKFSIKFNGPRASYLVCSIDLISLMFKYTKYKEHCSRIGEDASVETFIQNHLVPVWFEDLRRIWLFNLLETMFFGEFDITKCVMDQTISPNNLVLGILPDVQRIKTQMQQQNITLGNVLNTEWFDTYSIIDWLSVMEDSLELPNLQQYTYLKFLSEYPYVRFAIRVNNLCGTPACVSCNRELFQLLQRYLANNVFASITNSAMKQTLEKEVGRLCTEIKVK